MVLVVTQCDQPQGRGQQIFPSPIKELALSLGLKILQPASLKKGTADGDEFFQEFSKLNIDLAIVVAYGKIITERLLRASRKGFLNVHASLLPRFRGAAPIQRAIEMGDHETGVCLMDMVKGLDEGDVFSCKKTPILATDTSFTLFRRLSHLGASLLLEHLSDILAGRLKKAPQAHRGFTYARMLDKAEGLLDFKEPGKTLCLKVRAFDPWPACYGFVGKKRIKFFGSFFIYAPHVHKDVLPGTIVTIGEFLGVKTLDGILYFLNMQVEGKKVLPVKQALLGFLITKGDRIGSHPH